MAKSNPTESDFSLYALVVTTQFLSQVKVKDSSQLINRIFNVLRKLLKCFNATAISKSYFHRYVSNETPNNVSVERRQDVSAVRLHDVLLECCNDFTNFLLFFHNFYCIQANCT